MNERNLRDVLSQVRKAETTIHTLQQENAALHQEAATMKHDYEEKISRLNHHIQQLKQIIGNIYPYLRRSSNFIEGNHRDSHAARFDNLPSSHLHLHLLVGLPI